MRFKVGDIVQYTGGEGRNNYLRRVLRIHSADSFALEVLSPPRVGQILEYAYPELYELARQFEEC